MKVFSCISLGSVGPSGRQPHAEVCHQAVPFGGSGKIRIMKFSIVKFEKVSKIGWVAHSR
jgi:hypothetical protein